MAERIGVIRAVYDGKVFIPMEPVDLAVGTEVVITFLESQPSRTEEESIEALRRTIDAPRFHPG